jgi:hypothetical protein
MTQLERTHAASDINPSVRLHDSATIFDESREPSTLGPESTILLCALTK